MVRANAWEARVSVMLHSVTFLSSAFKLVAMGSNQSAEILQGGRGDNSFKIQAVDPDLSVQPNTLFLSGKRRKILLLSFVSPFFRLWKNRQGQGFCYCVNITQCIFPPKYTVLLSQESLDRFPLYAFFLRFFSQFVHSSWHCIITFTQKKTT